MRLALHGLLHRVIASWLVLASSAGAWAAGTYVPTYTIAIPGFRSYVATGYTPSARNIEFIKALKTPAPSLRLLKFDLAKNNKDMLLCRASFPVYGPNKTPFAALLEAAANLELVESGLAAQDAATVQATLDEFDFSSFGTGKWTMRATLTSPGKPPLVVSHEYTYPVSGGAVAGCTDVMNALVPGIEAFLYALYTDPRFAETLQSAP